MSSQARLLGNQNIGVGTVELGDVFGQVQSGTMSHMVDEEEVKDALDNVQAIIQTNERFEFSMECVLDVSAPEPIMGDDIVLPNGKTGTINKAEYKWTAGKSRGFTIEAVHRVSMGDNPAKSYIDLVP